MCLVSRPSQDMTFHVLVLAQSRHLYVSSPCLVVMSHVSRLSYVSPSGIVKCLFCVETLAILAGSTSLGPLILAVYLLILKRLILWLLFCGYNLS